MALQASARALTGLLATSRRGLRLPPRTTALHPCSSAGLFRRTLSSTTTPTSTPPTTTPAIPAQDTFGSLELGVEDKVTFHDYDYAEEDMDKQEQHEAKVADVLRPGPEDYLRRISRLVHNGRDLRAALQVRGRPSWHLKPWPPGSSWFLKPRPPMPSCYLKPSWKYATV